MDPELNGMDDLSGADGLDDISSVADLVGAVEAMEVGADDIAIQQISSAVAGLGQYIAAIAGATDLGAFNYRKQSKGEIAKLNKVVNTLKRAVADLQRGQRARAQNRVTGALKQVGSLAILTSTLKLANGAVTSTDIELKVKQSRVAVYGLEFTASGNDDLICKNVKVAGTDDVTAPYTITVASGVTTTEGFLVKNSAVRPRHLPFRKIIGSNAPVTLNAALVDGGSGKTATLEISLLCYRFGLNRSVI